MNQMLVAAGISFAVCVIVFPFYIKLLKRRQIEQFIRVEGPQSHAAKAKTPTMGGLCFLVISSLVSVVLIASWSLPSLQPALVVVATGVLCGLVGFVDDFAKINSQSNAGIPAKTRLLSEFALGFALGGILLLTQQAPIDKLIIAHHLPPLVLGGVSEILRLSYVLIVVPFLVAATTNALNLHDGMDGLAGGTSLLVFVSLALILGQVSAIDGFSLAQPLSVVAASISGALLAFLVYNRYPAKVFMGDTGSLFLGGMMAAIVAATGLTVWFIPFALIYIVETVSVILQVVYFKLTKDYTPETPMSKLALIKLKLTRRLPGEGKRLFRMAPLHHHFEAIAEEKGMPEWQVVACFWLVQLLLCALTCYLFLRLT